MVRLSATKLPSPAPPYVLEVKDIKGTISWDRRSEIQPVLVDITVEGLPRRDVKELTDAFNKLGSFRKVLVRLVPLEPPGGTLMFSGFIRSMDSGADAKTVRLEMEEAE